MRNWLIKKLKIDEIIEDKVNKIELDKDVILNSVYQVFEGQLKRKKIYL